MLARVEEGSLGFQYSSVTYTEPDIEISGFLPGVEGQYKLPVTERTKLEFRGRLGSGGLDYDGETINGNTDVTTTTDDLLANFETYLHFPEGYSNQDLQPVVGIGYRRWEDEIKDTTIGDTRVLGYKRIVEYVYLPLGFNTTLTEGLRWHSELHVSYRYFIEGTVQSKLSDANPDSPDVENTQENGDGVHLNYQYRRRTRYGSDYNIEVFLNIWDIGRSDVVATGADIDGDGSNDSVFEPENETTEIGARLSVNF